MGGLVIKKAYLLAQQDERYRGFAERIQAMFFLATPHRGSESARLLNNVLKASAFHNPKQYITDIGRNSGALSVVNDEFRFFSDNLQIWSFYETVKTRVGTNSVMIVERDSAVIGEVCSRELVMFCPFLTHCTSTRPLLPGHRQENVHPINADHRGICKFDSPSDPNYIFLRNSLARAIEDIRKG